MTYRTNVYSILCNAQSISGKMATSKEEILLWYNERRSSIISLVYEYVQDHAANEIPTNRKHFVILHVLVYVRGSPKQTEQIEFHIKYFTLVCCAFHIYMYITYMPTYTTLNTYTYSDFTFRPDFLSHQTWFQLRPKDFHSFHLSNWPMPNLNIYHLSTQNFTHTKNRICVPIHIAGDGFEGFDGQSTQMILQGDLGKKNNITLSKSLFMFNSHPFSRLPPIL